MRFNIHTVSGGEIYPVPGITLLREGAECFVEIQTLDELMRIIEYNGDIILNEKYIRIYDGYNE